MSTRAPGSTTGRTRALGARAGGSRTTGPGVDSAGTVIESRTAPTYTVAGFQGNKLGRKLQRKKLNSEGIHPKVNMNRSNMMNQSIKIFSTNAAGLISGKLDSLKNEIVSTNSNIVTVQETHSLGKGLIKMPAGFVVFEAI